MDKSFTRVIATWQGVIDAPAEDVWTLLTDWGAMLSWWKSDPDAEGVKVISVEMEDLTASIPRSRILTRSGVASAGLPVLNRETLLHEDPVARRIYYTADNEVIAGIRNYLATTSVDRIATTSCRMIFSSTFDVREGEDPSRARAVIESIYDAICVSFRNYFRKRSDANQLGSR